MKNFQETNTKGASLHQENHSPEHVKTLVLMIATFIGLYVCFLMTAPFLSTLIWALTLAVLSTPIQKWLESKLKQAYLAAIITTFFTILVIALPTLFVGDQLLTQVVKGSQLIESKINSGAWRHAIENQPQLLPIIHKVEQYINLPDAIKTFNSKLGAFIGAIVKGSVIQAIGFFLTFYILFFFLRDRKVVLKSILFLSPLTHKEMHKLYTRISDTIHATVYGTFAIASVQGFLGGLMFWWLDLPAPLLWGLVMGLLAIIPMLGAFIVWLPATLFLALEGQWMSATILLLWGMLVIGTIDNLLRPIFLGNRLNLHTVLSFLSIVGGLLLFGPAGLILGPVTLTVTITLLDIWFNRSAANLNEF
jgi:predicted PurR-regulated permease PerM